MRKTNARKTKDKAQDKVQDKVQHTEQYAHEHASSKLQNGATKADSDAGFLDSGIRLSDGDAELLDRTAELSDSDAGFLNRIPSWVYKVLIVFATTIWGFSFVLMKNVVEVIPPAWLLGFRFTSAGIILLVILFKHMRAHFSLRLIGAGALLGLFDFSAFWTQTVGLEYTTPGINAFLTATYCVIVPFLWWIIARRRPTIFNIGAAILAIAGIWFVSVSSSASQFSLGFGEGMTLLCALLFAIHIVFVSQFSRTHDVLALTVIQFLAEGALGLILGACTETLPQTSLITPEIIGSMVFLIIFASIVAFGIQNISLAHVPPAQASLFLSLESVFGVVFSVFLYGEQLTARLIFGFVLIFAAIVISETLPLQKKEAKGTPAD